jgi:demethylmenaquinone methyltransferase/2-methoxy-6-polyprenyl-1,4-benzoquinol methylase
MSGLPYNEVVWDNARLADPHGQPDKAARVRSMFDGIAPTYERVNRLLSAGRDGYWRRRAVALASLCAEDRVLDVACGTGDFARAFAAALSRLTPSAPAGKARVVGCDFSERMLALAPARRDDTSSQIRWCRGDALAAPFADASFTVVGCAFGVRNFASLDTGLREITRILRPGGRAVILEFSMPRSGPLAAVYRFYFERILPRLASWISRDRSGAYRYLPQSVSTFADARSLREALQAAGFHRVEMTPLTFGIVTATIAWKHA